MKIQGLPTLPDVIRTGRRAAVLLALGMTTSTLLAAPVTQPASSPVSTAATAQGEAPATDQSKEQLIRTLVKLTDKSELQRVFSQQFVDRVSSALSMFGPAMNPQTMRVVRQQTQAVVKEHIEDGDALYSVLAPVYQKHFNIVELNKLVNFYQSPLGQKLVKVSPQLLTESLDLGQQWGMSLVPEIVQRVQAQLNGQEPGSVSGDSGR